MCRSEDGRLIEEDSIRRRSSGSTAALEVYKRLHSNGRIMVCEAREQHCSTMEEGFVGRSTRGHSKGGLRERLLAMFGRLGNPEDGRRYLATAAVSSPLLYSAIKLIT